MLEESDKIYQGPNRDAEGVHADNGGEFIRGQTAEQVVHRPDQIAAATPND